MKKNFYQIGGDFELKETKLEVKKKKVEVELPAFFLNVGFYIIAPLILAVFLGLFLDSKFKTGHSITLIMISLGFISTIYNLFRLIKK